MKLGTAAAALLLAAGLSGARAETPPAPPGAFEQLWADALKNLGVRGAVDVPPANGTALPDDEVILTPEEQVVNFKYGTVTDRLKKILIGRRASKNSWPKAADRVDKGEIHWIVVHSAMGHCEGSIDDMRRKHAAAHYMVCQDGGVTRLVAIKNITLHVKNDDINAASVGIETETGMTYNEVYRDAKGRKRTRVSTEFLPDDWEPKTRWKMYSTLAVLIRAVAEEAKVPRQWGTQTSPGIIGHLEADLGIPDGHTDPGDDFYKKVFPAFDERYPGEGVTPKTFLMKLVLEDKPPTIAKLARGESTLLRVSDAAKAGLSKVLLFKSPKAAASKPVATWLPPDAGLPPGTVELAVPPERSSYWVEAYDLVGNMTGATLKPDAAGTGYQIKIETPARPPTREGNAR